MTASKLKQILGMAFLNSGVTRLLAPMGRSLMHAAYTIQFANWYRKNTLSKQLLPTDKKFGYGNRYKLYEYIAETYGLEQDIIEYLEFGVAAGGSLNWWIKKNTNPKSYFVGFDTFSGLPEDWGNIPKGTFSTKGNVPDIQDTRVSYQIGLFQNTLPNFIKTLNLLEVRTVIHIDCDLYSASLFALITLSPFLKKGDILIFDEFADVMNEYRACCDFMAACDIRLTIIKAVNGSHKIAFIVDE